jgi:GWxTD domain-containing protein
VRSFSIYCGVRKALALLIALMVVPIVAGAKKPAPTPENLTNVQLSPAYARWLVGPIYYLASDNEISQYLALTRDASAGAFIEAFWQRRDSNGAAPGNPLRETFEERVKRADVLFDQPPTAGHQTDRGTIYVLFGPPDDKEIDTATELNAPPLEVWTYSERPVGLNGVRARARIEFILAPDGTARLTRRPE